MISAAGNQVQQMDPRGNKEEVIDNSQYWSIGHFEFNANLMQPNLNQKADIANEVLK